MSEPKIVGGYLLLARKIIESEIFKKPPLYLNFGYTCFKNLSTVATSSLRED